MPAEALAGLRVVECGAGVSAAYAAKLMADMGADVVKVEPPDGDPLRLRGPFPGGKPDPEKSGLFLYLNTNKRGVVLDLTSADGRAAFDRIAQTADLVIHNWTPAEMEQRNVSWDRLHTLNPRLVLTSITPFGLTGPYSGYKANNLVSSSAGGWSWLIGGGPDGDQKPPLKAFGEQADMQTGAQAAIASLGAVLGRGFNDLPGQHIDISEQEVVTSFLEMNFMHWSYGGRVASRLGSRILHPWAIMEAKDGQIFVLCVQEDQWRRFVEMMGSPDWAEWEIFGDRLMRAAAWDVLEPLIAEYVSQHTVQEIYQEGLERRLPFAPLSTMGDLYKSDHLAVRGFFAKVTLADGSTLSLPGAPYRFQQTPWSLRRRAPQLGEHTAAVLDEAGMDPQTVKQLAGRAEKRS